MVLPGYMQKLKKSIDFIKKTYIAKIARSSSKFSKFKLADTDNMCIVYSNESNL